jgi:hypothetical protein
MREFIESFEKLIFVATKYINQEYFQLPIDGREDPIYRERVYCYELYHQLRINWPIDSTFTLSGEVDKSGHPLFREHPLLNTKPDLLIHQPGDMAGNLIVIEVKPINASDDGIKKDLITLTAFRLLANYHSAIYLIYGSEKPKFEKLKATAIQIANENKEINLNLIKLYWHSQINEAAKRISWNTNI